MKIVGHRGARGLAPENTLVSLQKALSHHVDMIEFDIRVTKDSVAILHHDADLVDPNGRKLSIKDTTYKDLVEHKPDLTTFEAALETIDRKVPAMIEVKPGEPIEPIIKAIKSRLAKGYPSDLLLLGSKSQKTLLGLHKALPDIKKVVIERWSGVKAQIRAKQVSTDILFMNERWLWFGFIRSVSHGHLQLYAYTVNNKDKAKAWEKYGLAGVITDYPNLFDKI